MKTKTYPLDQIEQPDRGHLVFTAKVGETITFRSSGDPEFTAEIVSVQGSHVRLRFNAPRSVVILRQRLADKLPADARILSRQRSPFAA